MKIWPALGVLFALTPVACRFPNEFVNTPRNAPHAVLRGTAYPNAGHIFAFHINGQPTSFWRSSDVFRIPAGTNQVNAAYSDRRETLGYKPWQFVATEGKKYTLTRKREPSLASPFAAEPHPTVTNAWMIYDRRDRVVIEQCDTTGAVSIVAEAPKEDYVFGVSSAAEAIASYQRKER